MSELFSYTGTQQIAHTSVPNIQVTPNLQAANAFKSLGNLIQTAQQTQIQGIQNESSMLQQRMQLENAYLAQKEDARKSAEDARKTEVEQLQQVYETKVTSARYAYDTAYANADGNVELQQRLTNNLLQDMGSLYSELDADVQDKVYKSYHETVLSYSKAHAKGVAAHRATTIKEREEAILLAKTNQFEDEFFGIEVDFNAAYAAAGDDLSAKQAAIDLMLRESSALYNSTEGELRSKVRNSYHDKLASMLKAHGASAQTIKTARLQTKISNAIPTIMSQSPEDAAATYTALLGEAKELNLDLGSFGKDFTNLLTAHAINSTDVESIVNNYDYEQILAIEEQIKVAAQVDPHNKQHVQAALEEVRSKLKNPIDTAVRSAISTAIETYDAATFEKFNAMALENGAVNLTTFQQNIQKFMKSLTSSGTLAKKTADTLMQANGNKVAVSRVQNQDPKVTKNLEGQILQNLQTMFASGELDYEQMKFDALENPEIFKKAYVPAVESVLGSIINAASVSAKTDEEKQVRMGNVIQRVLAAERLLRGANGAANKDLLLQYDIAHILTASDQIDALPDALMKLRAGGEFSVMSESSARAKALRKKVPSDMFQQALRTLSILDTVEGASPAEVMSTVVSRHSYEDHGMSFLVSGGVSEKLMENGATEANIGYMEQVLTDPLNYSPETQFKAEELTELFAKEGATVELFAGGIYASNDDGDSVYLPMDTSRMTGFTSAMSDLYLRENKPSVVYTMVDDAWGKIAEGFNGAYHDALATLDPIAATADLGADAVATEWNAMSNHAARQAENLDNFLGDIYLRGIPVDEALITLTSNMTISEEFYNHESFTGHREAYDNYKARLDTFVHGLKTGLGGEMFDGVVGLMEEFTKFIVSPAEAHSSEEIPTDGEMYVVPLTPEDAEIMRIMNNPMTSQDFKDQFIKTTPVVEASKKPVEVIPVDTLKPTKEEEQMLADLLVRESGSATKFKEGETHISQNGVKTTRFGIELENYPKKSDETDRDHALRVLRDHFVKPLQKHNIQGIPMKSLIKLAWNVGVNANVFKALASSDLGSKSGRKAAFKQVAAYIETKDEKAKGEVSKSNPKADRKVSKGLVFDRAEDWNLIAEEIDKDMIITHIRFEKDEEGEGTISRYFYFKNDPVRHIWRTDSGHSQSKFTFGKKIKID